MDDSVRRFLQLCLRTRHDPVARLAIGDLDPTNLDWESVAAAAQAERIAPLLYRTLEVLTIVPPRAIHDTLHAAYRSTLLRNVLLLHELKTALRVLCTAGVDVVVLKGALLADVVYRDVGLRPLLDIDVLIRREDLSSARRALAALGYSPLGMEPQAGATTAYENELELHKSGRIEILLDVHWSLFDSPHHQRELDMDWCWRTARPTPLGEGQGLVLGPEALLLHLCGHLVLHHSGDELLWLHDVAEVLAHYRSGIDWEQVLERARVCDLVVPVQRVLSRVADDWHAPLPTPVREALRALDPAAAERRILAWRSSDPRLPGRQFMADLAGMAAWRERASFAWSRLFPSPDYMRWRYRIQHPCLLPFYYPYRWLRGLRTLR